jgi:hypothetical protein
MKPPLSSFLRLIRSNCRPVFGPLAHVVHVFGPTAHVVVCVVVSFTQVYIHLNSRPLWRRVAPN